MYPHTLFTSSMSFCTHLLGTALSGDGAEFIGLSSIQKTPQTAANTVMNTACISAVFPRCAFRRDRHMIPPGAAQSAGC